MTPPATERQIVRFGLFEADLDQRKLSKDGLRVKVQEQPFVILSLLLTHPGEIVTREAIQQELWPGPIVQSSQTTSRARKLEAGNNGSGTGGRGSLSRQLLILRGAESARQGTSRPVPVHDKLV